MLTRSIFSNADVKLWKNNLQLLLRRNRRGKFLFIIDSTDLNSLSASVVQDQIYAGRPIRRLVSLFDTPRALVDENDRRLMLELDLEGTEHCAGGHGENHTVE
jgi:hypothetical protein